MNQKVRGISDSDFVFYFVLRHQAMEGRPGNRKNVWTSAPNESPAASG